MSDVVVLCATGDSTTFAAASWFYQASGIASNNPAIYNESSEPRRILRIFPAANRILTNMALSGWRIADLEAQATELDALIRADYSATAGRPQRHHILAVRIGTNVTSNDPAVSAARVRTYCLARQAAGWKVIICPIWSSGQSIGANFDTAYAQPQNAIFATWGAGDGVAAVCPATSALMYGTGAHSNGTYFSDGTHPTSVGYAIAAAEFSAVLESLISALTA